MKPVDFTTFPCVERDSLGAYVLHVAAALATFTDDALGRGMKASGCWEPKSVPKISYKLIEKMEYIVCISTTGILCIYIYMYIYICT